MRLIPSLVLLIFAVVAPALAQQPQLPPSRVGAVSYVSGTLAFHMAGETQWSAAGVNYPVATGGSFWTDPQSRAELQIGPSTLDMAPGTEIDVTNLDQQVAQIGIPQGRLYLHLRQLSAGQSFEIDLPQGAVWLLQPGAYDIDAGTADQPARVAVYQGTARFVGGGVDIGVKAGDAALLSGSNPVATEFERAVPDAFVAWCRARDYHQPQLAADYYVSPQMTGYADLDHYGGWQNNPQYGQVWYPSQVPADWAPYRDGRWIWVEPWGWTWVDQQPWGFAPFHYGRWAYVGDRWGWVPGQYAAEPVYAPALVAFIGGAAAGLAVAGESGPAVGWFPLAPDEPYWPSYSRNETYIRNVNAGDVRNIDTIVRQSNGAPPARAASANFANRRFATVVPQRVFANAAPVAPAAIHVAPAALAKAPVVLHPPAVRPPPRAAAVAVKGPQNLRPVPKGPGTPPAGHPAAPIANAPGAPPHPPGTPPGHAVGPGRPGTPPRAAAVPPHPGAVPAAGPHAPVASAAARPPERGRAPGPPAPGQAPHPAAGGLAPPRPGPLPPAREAHPGMAAPARPPAPAVAGHQEPPHPAAALQHPAAAGNQARPAAPHAEPARPPAPAPAPPIVRAAPIVHPPPPAAPHPQPPRPQPPRPAPPIVRAPPPAAPHPQPPRPQPPRPAPPIVRAPPPAAPHPQPPRPQPPHPQPPRPAPAVAHAPPPHPPGPPARAGKPAANAKGKPEGNHP